MPIDLDAYVERRASHCAKWNWFDDDVIPMWVADMDFRSPDAVVTALKERADHGIFGYPLPPASFKALLVERMATRHHWTILPEDIVFMPGLVLGLNLVSQMIGAVGDAVLTLTPIYPPFLSAPTNQGRVLQTASMALRQDDGKRITYELDMDALEAAVTPQTKLFLLCNPHNPAGIAFSRHDLEQIADFCVRHDLIICSDEIHCDLLASGTEHISIATLSREIAQRTITLLAPSKTFNIPGLKCSLAVVQNPDLAKRLGELVYGGGTGVNIMGFAGGEAAYRDGQEWLDNVLLYLQANRDTALAYLDEHLPSLKATCPQATYLLWIDCRGLALPEGMAAQTLFLERGRVALSNGADFGADGAGFVRLNYGTTREILLEGLGRMKAAVESLKVVAAG